ncbi:MAG: hypothetical protein HY695_21330 [Deltaproteobacteria bacterium]|nr:hypothetical protein [Deltaproteobacteria bacterium]
MPVRKSLRRSGEKFMLTLKLSGNQRSVNITLPAAAFLNQADVKKIRTPRKFGFLRRGGNRPRCVVINRSCSAASVSFTVNVVDDGGPIPVFSP